MTDLPRENVQSYPRPPALEPVPQRITIRLGVKRHQELTPRRHEELTPSILG